MPTVNCLVELTEMPFTVITLSGEYFRTFKHYFSEKLLTSLCNLFSLRVEVNLVNLERVGFNLRNFDMIFVWKVRRISLRDTP